MISPPSSLLLPPKVALDVADYNQKMFKWYMHGGYKSHSGIVYSI
jgi:hypothetical protein